MPGPVTSSSPIRELELAFSPNKVNIQSRLAELVADIIQVLSESSRHEREHINTLKEKIHLLADGQASAQSAQGWVAVASGVVSFGAALIPFIPLANMKHLAKGIEGINGGVSKYVGSIYDVKGLQASSSKELCLREFDNANNDMQGKSATRREFMEALKEVNQLALTASHQ